MSKGQFMMHARMKCHIDKSISIGAKVLFAHITDCCHDEKFGGNQKGELTGPVRALAAMLAASPKSVAKWIGELKAAGYITADLTPGSFPTYIFTVRNHGGQR